MSWPQTMVALAPMLAPRPVGAGVAAAVDRAARVRYVGEHAGTEEDVVVARDAFINAHVVLDLDVAKTTPGDLAFGRCCSVRPVRLPA